MMSNIRNTFLLTVLGLILTGVSAVTHAQIMPGDAIVVNAGDPTIEGAILTVDLTNPATFGDRTLISDFGDNTQGDIGQHPRNGIFDSNGDLLVVDTDAGTSGLGALFIVDMNPGPTFGHRTLISDFGDNSQGETGSAPFDVILNSDGNALVVDINGGTSGLGALFIVDMNPGPTFGHRTLISDFGDNTQGDIGEDPRGATFDSNGNLLVIDSGAGTLELGALFIVDMNPGATFGHRTLISDFGDNTQGELGRNPAAVTLDASGNALVVDADGPLNPGSLFNIDLNNVATFGHRTVISDFSDSTQGELGVNPLDFIFYNPGNALVVDLDAGTTTFGALFMVDMNPGGATFGHRTLISDFGDNTQGELGRNPWSVNIIPNSDLDGDGVQDFTDNCPNDSNADQTDMDQDGEGDTCDADDDGDNVNDDIDECTSSNIEPTVEVDGCDSGVENVVDDVGCTIADSIEEIESSATNHGDFVSGVSALLNELKKSGLISGSQKEAIQMCSASADIP